MAKGFLYVAQNSSMPGLLKIGRTAKIPTERLAELFTTGVPEPFEIAYYALVQDSKKTEKEVHELLDRYRHTENREFFATGIGTAIRAIRAFESPEHEWKNLERRHFKPSNNGLRNTANYLIELDSRHGVASEEKELEEFAQAIQDKENRIGSGFGIVLSVQMHYRLASWRANHAFTFRAAFTMSCCAATAVRIFLFRTLIAVIFFCFFRRVLPGLVTGFMRFV